MSAEQEMRNVILHAADLLRDSRDKTVACNTDHHRYGESKYFAPRAVGAASAYAEGVLRLLASYLAVEDAPRLNGQVEARREGGRVRAAVGERDEHGRFVKAPAAGTGTEGAG